MITSAGLTEIADTIKGIIAKGTYRIGTTTRDVPVFSTELEGNIVKVKLYLDDSIDGTINRLQLVSFKGTVLAERPDSIVKPGSKGLLAIFNINIREV